MKTFDQRFGVEFFASLPAAPGIYRFFNADGGVIYVGKAKNLRRRLAQYRNARRRKAHAKMRKIVKEACRLEFEVCETEFDALRRENEAIQSLRPKWNVAGAFFFLYPLVGTRRDADRLSLCYTTTPEAYPDFQFHGSFRSRQRTKEGFFALRELLGTIGHGRREKSEGKGYLYVFRQIPSEWIVRCESFFRGDDFAAIEELSLLLLERPGARARAKETQDLLHAVRRFWRHEIQALKRARERTRWPAYPVAQKDRDGLFISYREAAAVGK